jgi:hypothetical protein
MIDMPGKDFSLQQLLMRKNSEGNEENYGMLTVLQGANSTSITLEFSPEAEFNADRKNIKNNCTTHKLLCVPTLAAVEDQGKKTHLSGYCIVPVNSQQTVQALKIIFSCSSLSQMSAVEKDQITKGLLSGSSLYNASSSAMYTASTQSTDDESKSSSTHHVSSHQDKPIYNDNPPGQGFVMK